VPSAVEIGVATGRTDEDPRGASCGGWSAEDEAAFQSVLTLVRERAGTDFSYYRSSTVRRRVQNRMVSLGARSVAQYLAILASCLDETVSLIERITIKVSRFYRNAGTFDVLRQQVMPALARDRSPGPVRAWSAGCGNGEEPYSLAMLLDEARLDGWVEATDVDGNALKTAEAGLYPAPSAAELPPELAGRYLETVVHRNQECRRVRDPLRSRVRFSRHDLTTATGGICETNSNGLPFPGDMVFDLICCRNVLIYFQRSVQERVLHMFCAALAPRGFLCLGEAEWPSAALGPLEVLDQKARVFRAPA
jgi:chemotaxis methyl-accepting protein methylase